MNALVNATNNAPVTMTSLELVDFINSQRIIGEALLAHSDFMKKVPKVLGEGHGKFSDTYIHAQNGQTYPCYVFPKRESCLMAMSYSYELQAAVFDKMTALENQLIKPAFTLPDFNDPGEAAIAWAAEYNAKKLAIAERDHAIATKAQIGSKREATAMATASAAARKVKSLEVKLDQSRDYASVKKIEAITKRKFEWKPLKHWSIEHGIDIQKATDANYEKGVNTYSSSAWLAVYGVDIYALECAQ